MAQDIDRVQALVGKLFDVGAVEIADGVVNMGRRLRLHDTNPTAPLSPIYFSLRTEKHPKNPGKLDDEALQLIRQLFLRELATSGIHFDYYAGIPEAGEVFADLLDDFDWEELWWPVFKPPKRLHLKKIEIDGKRTVVPGNSNPELKADGEVLLVDDLVTAADTKLDAILALKKMGLKPTAVLVAIDREQGGTQVLEEQGYRVLSLVGMRQALQLLVYTGRIQQTKAQEILDYVAKYNP